MNLGPYAGFIIAAYAAALAVVVALIGWIIADHRSQLRTLHDLDARGISRRSSTREIA
ncbi:MAG: heme exporter protein CcmD [Xanthobacteraceae bacterium]